MARFIIHQRKGTAHLFETKGPRTEVGRADDMNLILTNVSVSRHHACFECENDRVVVVDVGSQNGIRVGTSTVEANGSQALKYGDEVQIGNYTLVLLDPKERFYKGRCVKYMTAYSTLENEGSEQSTYQLSAGEIQAMEQEKKLIRHAMVVMANDPRKFWHPEDHSLTLGKDGMIRVGGFLTGAIAAELSWENKRHVLNKAGGLSKLWVNGASVKRHTLNPGDRFKVGDTDFIYQVD